jgi:hypothetical protein
MSASETTLVQWLQRKDGGFADPFADYSGTQMPSTMGNVLKWCELLWHNDGTYRMAMERVVSYFLTKVMVTDVSDQQKEHWEDFLEDTLKIMSVMRIVGLDFMCYGNSFTSLYVPFRRFLACKSCGFEQPIDKTNAKYKRLKFTGVCNKCKHNGEMDRRDRRSRETDKVEIIRWNPHHIKMMFHPLSHQPKFLYEIPGDLKKNIRNGIPFYVNNTPWEIIEAIHADQLFMFKDDVVFHMKEETLAGIQNRGWGVPRALSNFKQAWYIQVMRRYNEALALDYIVPWRLITPGQSASREADPLIHQNLSNFSNRIERMVKRHRQDPADVNVLPFPVEYQALGGEAKALAPQELMASATDELLNAAGIPAELYRGSLTLQSMPTALRLFESTWPHLVSQLNSWLDWLMASVAQAFNWDPAKATLEPVRHADDIEGRTIRLQLAAANQISLETAFRPLGIKMKDEIERKFDEQRMMMDAQREFEQEQAEREAMEQRVAETAMMRQQGAGAAPGMMGGPGGAPPGGGMMGGAPGGATPAMGNPMSGPGPTSPQEMQAAAQQTAQQLLSMDETTRRSELINLKRTDPTMHSLVKAALEDMRTEMRSQGQQQMQQQMQGQGGAPMPM